VKACRFWGKKNRKQLSSHSSMKNRTLEEQRIEFINQKFLATPLAGIIIWAIIGLVGIFFSDFVSVWAVFIGTGSIVYLASFVSKGTAENFMDKKEPKIECGTLSLVAAGQAMVVYSIAIPLFLVDYASLPTTVGILTGLMWLPLSRIIKH